jgi:pyridoxal phosphate enzyme (YggS family)
MGIRENLKRLKEDLPQQVELIAVSKTKPISDLLEAYDAGQRAFGENKIREMVTKWEQMPKDIQWHMIGHVQSNKVKYMAPFVHTIHAVDSIKLLKEIQKQAAKNERIINCLIQIRIAKEETKFGLDASELDSLLSQGKEMPNIVIKGLMGMATFTEDQSQIRSEFKNLADLYRKYSSFEVLSMGMSGDYDIAIEEGYTSILVGSKKFG